MTEIWYKNLVDDLKQTLIELGYISRQNRIEIFHLVGQRIVDDINFKKWRLGNKKALTKIAKDSGTSTRTLYYCMKFVEKFPTLDLLPVGKDISWSRIVNEFLTTRKQREKKADTQCPYCKRWFIGNKKL